MPVHIACLSFDFDAMSPSIRRGLTSPTAISRGEFGVVGAGRILSLLQREGIRATWFVPGHTLETYPEICRRIAEAGHEIGHHGYMHEPPAELDAREEETVLQRGIAAVARVTGDRPRGYRSPSWDLSPRTVDLLIGEGFVYDSSMMGHDDQPYFARSGDTFPADGPAQFGRRTELVEMPVSWSLDDFPVFEFQRSPSGLLQGLRRASDVLANWTEDFRYMVRETEWGALTFTMHPQVIGRGHRMLMLEQLIDALRQLGATFTTLEDAAARFQARGDGGVGVE